MIEVKGGSSPWMIGFINPRWLGLCVEVCV